MPREVERVYDHIQTLPKGKEVVDKVKTFFNKLIDNSTIARAYCHVNDEVTTLGLPPVWEQDATLVAYMMRLHIFANYRMRAMYDGRDPGDTYRSFVIFHKENN